MRRLLLGLAVTAAAVAAPLAGVASAAQTNAKNSLPLTLSCSNGHTYQAVTNGSGRTTPAHLLDSPANVAVPSTLTFTFTDLTTGDSETQTVVKNGPKGDVSCTFASPVFPGGPNGDLAQITGSAIVQISPN